MRKFFVLVLGLVFAVQLTAQNGLEPKQPYLVADFNEKSLESVLEICQKGGFEYLLERTPFSTYGHYQWNPEFASNEKQVARMAQKAEEHGVHLGLLVQPDAISENDAYCSSKFCKQFLREGHVELFSDLEADECDIALRYTNVIQGVSSLNLILIDNELISYGTIERAGDLLLLHHCTRGAYGTRATSHSAKAEAFKLWDSPDRFVAPEGALRDSVRMHLERQIADSQVAFVLQVGDPGQDLLDASLRVIQVERWTSDEGVAKSGCLGWIKLHAANKKQDATSIDEVEWMMSKAVGFDAYYGLLIDKKAMKEHGRLDEIMEAVKRWEEFRRNGTLTETQLEELRDPYLDWHLEQNDDKDFQLYQWNFSRRYRCNFVEADSLLIGAEPWEWKVDQEGGFGLWLQVDGKEAIKDPMVNTEKGLVMIPCVIKPGERLEYNFGEVAILMDANHKKIKEISIEGVAMLPEGTSQVHFFCETEREGAKPEVTLRYITSSKMVRYQLENYHK